MISAIFPTEVSLMLRSYFRRRGLSPTSHLCQGRKNFARNPAPKLSCPRNPIFFLSTTFEQRPKFSTLKAMNVMNELPVSKQPIKAYEE